MTNNSGDLNYQNTTKLHRSATAFIFLTVCSKFTSYFVHRAMPERNMIFIYISIMEINVLQKLHVPFDKHDVKKGYVIYVYHKNMIF